VCCGDGRRESNTKLRALAKQLLAEIATLPPPSVEVQGAFDHLLLTAHERILGEPTHNLVAG
jgi:hypothetical protein